MYSRRAACLRPGNLGPSVCQTSREPGDGRWDSPPPRGPFKALKQCLGSANASAMVVPKGMSLPRQLFGLAAYSALPQPLARLSVVATLPYILLLPPSLAIFIIDI